MNVTCLIFSPSSKLLHHLTNWFNFASSMRVLITWLEGITHNWRPNAVQIASSFHRQPWDSCLLGYIFAMAVYRVVLLLVWNNVTLHDYESLSWTKMSTHLLCECFFRVRLHNGRLLVIFTHRCNAFTRYPPSIYTSFSKVFSYLAIFLTFGILSQR